MKHVIAFLILITSLLFGKAQNTVHKILADDRNADARFGSSISVSASDILIGAKGEKLDATGQNELNGAGAVYSYQRDTTTGVWIHRQKLVASDRDAGDQFGFSVAVSGDYAIVGANRDDEDENGSNPLNDAGSAYIFERDAQGFWQMTQKLVAFDNRNGGHEFGRSVEIEGNFAFVGAYHEGSGANPSGTFWQGAVYVFQRNSNGEWTAFQKIKASNIGYAAEFGYSISASGTSLIVGARAERRDETGQNSLTGAGAAYFFERDMISGLWQQSQKVVSPYRAQNNLYGSAVSISGNYAVVGEPFQGLDASGGNGLTSAGAVHVYEKDGNGTWVRTQTCTSVHRTSQAQFGNAVSIRNETILIGAFRDSGDETGGNPISRAGAVYQLTRDLNGNWNFSTKWLASDRTQSAEFGASVAQSETQFVVGAPGQARDINGSNPLTDAGAAYAIGPAGTTSIDQHEWHNRIRIYPNPTSGFFNLELGNTFKEITVLLRDIRGKVLMQPSTYQSPQLLIQINGPAGMYFLEIRIPGSSPVMKKVVKQ